MKFNWREFFSGIFAAPVAAVTLAPSWKRLVKDTGYWWEDVCFYVRRFLNTGRLFTSPGEKECPTPPDDQGGGDSNKPARPDLWPSYRPDGWNIDASKIIAGKIDVSGFRPAHEQIMVAGDRNPQQPEPTAYDPWELAYER